MPVQFTVENGDYTNSTVDVRKNGISVLSRPGQKNFHLKLEYGNKYLLSFSRPGYITKKILVDTDVPDEHGKQTFEPYKIGVRLYKQYEGVNIVVYNQPVASIKYQHEMDEFNYDVDYTKSILSALNEAELKLEQKAREERELIKQESLKKGIVTTAGSPDELKKMNVNSNPGSSTQQKTSNTATNVNASAQSAGADHKKGQAEVGSDHKTTFIPDEGADVLAMNKPSAGEDNDQKPIAPAAGDTVRFSSSSDINDVPIVYVNRNKEHEADIKKASAEMGQENITPLKNNQQGKDAASFRLNTSTGKDNHFASADAIQNISKIVERTVETNRVITTVKITEGTHITEYRRVTYNWGGEYFFMNRITPISEHLFDAFTK